jgi:hypothetical protein
MRLGQKRHTRDARVPARGTAALVRL